MAQHGKSSCKHFVRVCIFMLQWKWFCGLRRSFIWILSLLYCHQSKYRVWIQVLVEMVNLLYKKLLNKIWQRFCQFVQSEFEIQNSNWMMRMKKNPQFYKQFFNLWVEFQIIRYVQNVVQYFQCSFHLSITIFCKIESSCAESQWHRTKTTCKMYNVYRKYCTAKYEKETSLKGRMKNTEFYFLILFSYFRVKYFGLTMRDCEKMYKCDFRELSRVSRRRFSVRSPRPWRRFPTDCCCWWWGYRSQSSLDLRWDRRAGAGESGSGWPYCTIEDREPSAVAGLCSFVSGDYCSNPGNWDCSCAV